MYDNDFMTRVATPLKPWALRGILFLSIALSGLALGQEIEDHGTIPEPAAIWASSPLDITIAFPRHVTAGMADSLVGRTVPYFQAKAPSATGSAPALPIGSIRIAGA